MLIFETRVIGIGSEAELFKEEKMIILFGESAPNGLAEYCYNIIVNSTEKDIEVGMFLKINSQAYQITSVGSVVNNNLNQLGHITIKFDGSVNSELPGTLYVEEKKIPVIEVGSIIEISEA